MYSVDEKDRVIELSTAPQCSPGAPLPLVLADEDRLLLAYIVSERDPGWDGTAAELVSPDSEGKAIAIVTFASAYCHMFGPPNDEAFSGHPLAGRGLERYSVAEVVGSSWIRRLEAMNSVHPYHKPEHFTGRRHFIFAFQDSTFECIAEDFAVTLRRGTLRDVLREMTEQLFAG